MDTKTRVMVDLETLGNKPGAVIVSIGAVKFGAGAMEEFYRRIDARSCVQVGLTMDVETVLWWLKQSSEARSELTQNGDPLEVVLGEFSQWVADPVELWGNGAAFDNAILAAAYDQVGLSRPWKFWNDRCYRTIKALHPEIPIRRSGCHHNALDDARSQAEHLLAIENL